MRGRIGAAACLALATAGIGAAHAESGSFFKSLMGGGGVEAPNPLSGKAMDPNEAYCPSVVIAEGGAAIQAYAGAAGDASRLRHQIKFGHLGRECAVRADGTLAVKVGVELRALLGPAGASGTFEAPLTVSIIYNDKTVVSRARRVSLPVPTGSAQGSASVVENELIVPADMAGSYDIVVSLTGQAGRPKTPNTAAKTAPKTAAKRVKPDAAATAEASAADGPAAVQSVGSSMFDAAGLEAGKPAGSSVFGTVGPAASRSLFDKDVEVGR